MTWNNRIRMMIILASVLVVSAVAQDMTKEEWQKQMQELTARRDQLASRLSALQSEVSNLRQQDAAKIAELQKCEDELLALVGATEETARVYETELARIDRWLDELARLSNQDLWNRKKELDDIQASINNAKKNKLSAVPKYYDRLANQQSRLDGLKRSLDAMMASMTYTVGTWSKDRDCLWNIAKKPTIYDNAFLWPKIWQGNRDQIKNPDIIHPGQKLKIPMKAELTAEEKSATRSYWQAKKSTQMEQP